MTLTYYQVRPQGDTNEANWETVAAGNLPQVVGSLSAGDYEVRALAAGGWSGPVTVTASATAPAAFAAGQWLVNGDGEVTLIALPADGGSMITSVEYQVDTGGGFGAWTALAGIALDTPYATTAAEGNAIRLRAVNAIGAGTESAAKTVIALRVFMDDFEGRTERLGASANWEEASVGIYQVANGYCYADEGTGQESYVTGEWGNDQYVEIVSRVVNVTFDMQGPRCVVRKNPANRTCYRWQVRHTGDWFLERLGGTGTPTEIATGSTTAPGLNTDFTQRLEVEGTTLRGYLNGTLVMTQTDGNIASGVPALVITSGQTDRTWARALSFEAGEL